MPRSLNVCFSAAFAAMVLTLSFLLFAGCRDKAGPTGPGPGPTGDWQIVLEDTSTIYVPLGGGNSDPIKVRLFDPNGNIAPGKLLSFTSDVEPNRVTPSATTTDTLGQYPWGCNPALIYWGTGGDDQENPHEIIHAYYVNLQTHDTLADTTASYRVQFYNP